MSLCVCAHSLFLFLFFLIRETRLVFMLITVWDVKIAYIECFKLTDVSKPTLFGMSDKYNTKCHVKNFLFSLTSMC